MGTVRNILAAKAPGSVQTTQRATTVFEAIGKMTAHGIGSLIVMEGAAVVGIVTERDYMRKIALEGRSSRQTTVAAIMSYPVITVAPTDTIGHCMALMTEARCRHLPVVEQGVLVGAISIGDCVKRLVREQEDEIRHLNDYIAAGPRPH